MGIGLGDTEGTNRVVESFWCNTRLLSTLWVLTLTRSASEGHNLFPRLRFGLVFRRPAMSQPKPRGGITQSSIPNPQFLIPSFHLLSLLVRSRALADSGAS